jgi:hypothetical protein
MIQRPLLDINLHKGVFKYRTASGFARHHSISGFAPILLLLVVAALGALGYFSYKSYTKNPKTPSTIYQSSTTPTNLPVNMSDWETYSNSSMGISFKYPDNYTIISSGPEKVVLGFSSPSDTKATPYLTISTKLSDLKLLINCIANPDILPCWNSNLHSEGEYKINVGDRVGNAIDIRKGKVDSDYIVIQLLEPKLEIEMNVSGGGLAKQFDQILSTFKFTNNVIKTDTSNWKVYPPSTIVGLPYSFRYPVNAEMDEVQDRVSFAWNNSFIHHQYLAKTLSLDMAINNYHPFGVENKPQFTNQREKFSLGILNGFKVYEGNGSNTYLFLEATNKPGILVFYHASDDLISDQMLSQMLSTFKLVE